MAISVNTNVPQLPPLRVVTVNKRYHYLWLSNKKKYQGRIADSKIGVSVGKIVGDLPTGLVAWKQDFIEQYPELKAYNVYREEVTAGELSTNTEYRFVFRPKTGTAETNSMQTAQYYQAGATWMCDHILRDSPLLAALNRTFRSERRSLKLLSLAYYTLLHHSIDFSAYLYFCADTRLAWQGSMTEFDINELLQGISDVDLSCFFATLQTLCARRFNRKTRYYALEITYPHELTEQMRSNAFTLTTNFAPLDKELRKLVKNPHVNVSQDRMWLQRWSQFQDDTMLLVCNANSGIPHLCKGFRSKDFPLSELCAYLRQAALPQEQAQQQVLSLALERKTPLDGQAGYGVSARDDSFAQANQSNAAEQSSRTKEKSSALAIAKKVQATLDSLGSYSGLGGIKGLQASADGINARGGQPVITSTATNAVGRVVHGSQGSETDPFLEDDENSSTNSRRSIFRTLKASEVLAANSQGIQVSHRSGELRGEARLSANEVVFVTAREQQIIATLRYLLQQQQGFLWVAPPQHNIFKRLLSRQAQSLLEMAHYNAEQQCFSLTFALNQHYPEYDISVERTANAAGTGAGAINGATGSLDGGASLFVDNSRFLPRKMLSPMYVHIVFDLKPLFALKEQQESNSEDELDDEFERKRLDFYQDEELMEFMTSDVSSNRFWHSRHVMRASTFGSMELSDEQCVALDSIKELLERQLALPEDEESDLSPYISALGEYEGGIETHTYTTAQEQLKGKNAGQETQSAQADVEADDLDEDDFFSVPDDDDFASDSIAGVAGGGEGENSGDSNDAADLDNDFFSVPDDDDFAPSSAARDFTHAAVNSHGFEAEVETGEADDVASFLDVPNDDDDDVLDVGSDADAGSDIDSDDANDFAPSSHYLRTGEVSPQALAQAGLKVKSDTVDSGLFADDEDEDDFEVEPSRQARLSKQEQARLQRYLHGLLNSDIAFKSGALRVLVSNRLEHADEAMQVAQQLHLSTRAFDLMSFDVFKVEQARCNPMIMDFNPSVQQLLRGKNFVIFLALSIHFMVQAALQARDRQYGSTVLRDRLHIKDVPQYLQLLQQIVAERTENGFVYRELPLEVRALLEYVHVAAPAHEVFSDSTSDTEVRLARV